MEEFKTFEDLEFKEKYSKKEIEIFERINENFKNFKTPIRARLNFKNGYGISVISGGYSYTNNENEYEIAVLKNNNLCYSTPITDDVIGYLTKEQVTELMEKIQKLEN